MAFDDLLALIPIFVFIIVPLGIIYLIFKGIKNLNQALKRLGKQKKSV